MIPIMIPVLFITCCGIPLWRGSDPNDQSDIPSILWWYYYSIRYSVLIIHDDIIVLIEWHWLLLTWQMTFFSDWLLLLLMTFCVFPEMTLLLLVKYCIIGVMTDLDVLTAMCQYY